MKIKELQTNQSSIIRCAILDIVEKMTKNNEAFCTLTVTDGETQIQGNIFRVRKDQIYERYFNHVADITLEYDGRYYNIKKLSYVEDADIGDYIIKAPMDPEKMYAYILETLKSCVPKCDAARVAVKLYEDNKEKLIYWSAAKSVHHNIRSGLLWHTYRMIVNAKVVARVYLILDTPLLITGAAVHDIGKLIELETSPLGNSDYGIDGHLFGHLLLGIEMVDEAARKIGDINPESLRLLKHMIASHHGNLEWGAISKPSTPEAIALFLIDMMDARMFICERELKDIEPGSLTKPIFGIDNSLYKSVPVSEGEEK